MKNSNWWEDAFDYDHKFKALWEKKELIKTKRIPIEAEQFLHAALDTNSLRTPFEFNRQVKKPENSIYSKSSGNHYLSQSKLTERDVLSIRDLNKLGLSNVEISKKFNVSCETIRLIITKKTWTHI